MNQEPEAPADLEALLSDPNLLPSEREALTHLLAASMALPQDEPQQGRP